MNYDIRVVEDNVTGVTQVAHVTYDEAGGVLDVLQPPISEHLDLQGALTFIDHIYKASLKAVLTKWVDGKFE